MFKLKINIYMFASALAVLPTLVNAFNAARAYPPSCLSSTLPDTPSGPSYSADVILNAQDASTGVIGFNTETVTITVWREPCSSSEANSGVYNAATMMRIERQPPNVDNSRILLLYPDISVQQGDINFDEADGSDAVRTSREPNTYKIDSARDGFFIHNNTFVLENYDTNILDFNQAFLMRFVQKFPVEGDDGDGGSEFHGYISVPDYTPTQETYPGAFQGLPISGYMTSNYYDPAHSGEGMVVQVFELGASNLAFSFEWFTYDDLGLPYWLAGVASIDRDTYTVDIPAYYYTNGGFSGDFGAAVTSNDWGTVTVHFPNCNTMNFTYSSTIDLAGIPSGICNASTSCSRSWTRIANLHGLTCE